MARHDRRRPDRDVCAREARDVREARRRASACSRTAPASACRRSTSSRTSGGRPANFIAISGAAAAAEGVRRRARGDHAATSRCLASIFFNIFGGITRCDEVARGILAALDRLDVSTLPDRGAARRDERRGGPADPRRRRARERRHHPEADDARRRAARRWSWRRRTTGLWNERAAALPRRGQTHATRVTTSTSSSPGASRLPGVAGARRAPPAGARSRGGCEYGRRPRSSPSRGSGDGA